MKETWNPAEISEDIKPVNYVNADSWNAAELNEAIDLFGIKYPVDTWNPAELDEKARNIINDITSIKTITGNPISFKTINGGYAKSCEVSFSPIQSGSGDPSPENVRPISGRDSLYLWQSGINLWDEEYLSGYYNSSGVFNSADNQICTKNILNVKPSTEIYIKVPFGSGSTGTLGVCEYAKDGTFLRRVTTEAVTTLSGGIAFTPSSDCFGINVNFSAYYGATYNHNISINYPSTDTAYHKSEGNATHTATFPDTEYSGKITWNGDGSVNATFNTIYLSFTSANYYGIYGTENAPLFYVSIYGLGIKNMYNTLQAGILISNQLKKTTDDGNGENMGNNEIRTEARINPTKLYFRMDQFTDETTINAHLADYPLQVVAEIDTPTEITLTPETIELLKGANVLWTDVDSVELKYAKLAIPEDSDALSLSQKVKKAIEIIKGKEIKEETKKSTTKGRRKKP